MTSVPGHRTGGRWRVVTLVAWLGMPSLVIAAEPRNTMEVQSRLAEGKQLFGERQYGEAAEIFTEVLGQIEEVLINRAWRENVMLNTLIAYEWAYRSSTDDEGRKDVSLLDAGQRVLDEYRSELSRVYGAEATPSRELIEAIARYEDARRIADEAHGSPKAEPPETEPSVVTSSSPPPSTKGKGCGGHGGGSVAWLGVIPLAWRRRRVLERVADRRPADVVRRLRDRDA